MERKSDKTGQNFKVGELVYVPHFKDYGIIQSIYTIGYGDHTGEPCYRTKMFHSKGHKDQEDCLDWVEMYLRKITKLDKVLL